MKAVARYHALVGASVPPGSSTWDFVLLYQKELASPLFSVVQVLLAYVNAYGAEPLPEREVSSQTSFLSKRAVGPPKAV
jgi:hypothetical protein